MTPRQTENAVKEICRIFKTQYDISITREVNKKIVNFLDITLNLNTGIYKPFLKENNTIHYVHAKSNHPPRIISNIPVSIEKRLSKLSANEEVFKEAAPPYQNALDRAGYQYQLSFKPTPTQARKKKNRKRNITYFIPPYSANVKTRIGQEFFKIIKELFPPSHKLHSTINKNTIKLSYRVFGNMGQWISSHNSKVLSTPPAADARTCDCRCFFFFLRYFLLYFNVHLPQILAEDLVEVCRKGSSRSLSTPIIKH